PWRPSPPWASATNPDPRGSCLITNDNDAAAPVSLGRGSPEPDLFRGEHPMTTTTNGVRKTLASQLDRLDSILDGLSDGLSEAVSTAVEGAVGRAVKQAVGEAVRETLQAVLAEALTNADLLAAARTLLAPGSPADGPADPPEPREPPRGLFR